MLPRSARSSCLPLTSINVARVRAQDSCATPACPLGAGGLREVPAWRHLLALIELLVVVRTLQTRSWDFFAYCVFQTSVDWKAMRMGAVAQF